MSTMPENLRNLVRSRKRLWDSLPGCIKIPVGWFAGLVPPERLLGRQFELSLGFARDAERWPAERIRETQLARLREILETAYHKTEFYRHRFRSADFHPGDLNSLDDFRKVPLIDRSMVCRHAREMLSVSPNHSLADKCSTGATGGEPLHFYINADRSATEYGYLVASWERTGYRLGMPMAVLRGRTIRPDRNGLFHEYDPVLRHHYYSSFRLSDENMARYLEHMGTIGPCFLHVYPSTVAALSRFVLRSGARVPKNIRGIIAESEIVYPEQRQTAEDVLGCRYFSGYGHSEKLVLAAECERSRDYHVWPTYGYFELLDDKDNPVTTPGERGEIVGTGFINTVMPFIRYRTGDWATYVGSRCEACGREHVIIRDIRGHRTQEVLIAADGSEIFWTALNMHDDTFARVRQFQFMQEIPGHAVLRIVPAESFCEEDERRIHHNLERKLEDQLAFSIEIVDATRVSARGKAIYVDQRIDIEGKLRAHQDRRPPVKTS